METDYLEFTQHPGQRLRYKGNCSSHCSHNFMVIQSRPLSGSYFFISSLFLSHCLSGSRYVAQTVQAAQRSVNRYKAIDTVVGYWNV